MNKWTIKKKASKKENLISLNLTSNDFTEDNPYTKNHVEFDLTYTSKDTNVQVYDTIKFKSEQEINDFKNMLIREFEKTLNDLKLKFTHILDSKK